MTSGVRALSSTKRDEVLHAACDRGETMEILVERDGRGIRHSSRFLRAVISDDDLHLVVEMPSQHGKWVEYHPHEDLEVLFHVGAERYGFFTHVEGRCIHELDEEQKVAALVLGYPREVESRQRRTHYRVPLSTGTPVGIAFVEDLGRNALPEMFSIYSGFISDISAGGVAITCRQRLPVSIEAGTPLRISFQLPGESEQLNLKGVVRNIRRTDTDEARILGVEYLRDDYDIRGRCNIQLIHRFVVKRQRDILKKLRML